MAVPMTAGATTPALDFVPRRPVLSGLYHVVPLGPDRVQVCNAGRSVVLSGDGVAASLPPLLASLDGTRTTAELAAAFPDSAPALLRDLAARGLLLDAEPARARDPAHERAAMALASGDSPHDAAARLRSAKVGLSGGGPVSLSAAVYVAMAGVGHLLVDAKGSLSAAEVAASPVLPRDATGRLRIDAVRDAVAGVVQIDVVEADDLASAHAHIVAVEQRYAPEGMHPPAADTLLAAGVPFVVHGQDALQAAIGPIVQRGGKPCHRCVETRRQSNIAHIDEHRAYLAHRAAHAPASDAFVAAHTAIVAGHLAAILLRAALGTARRDTSVLVVDLGGGGARCEPVLTVPGCEGCLGAPA